MFRRGFGGARGNSAQDDAGEQSPGATQTTKTAEKARPAAETAKGRPTPKRSEAERGRRQGITGTPSRSATSGRAGAKASAADQRADRAHRNEAMRRGEQWALPARDRGPVKALARDYIDSRRRLSEYYMYLMIVLVVVLFIRSKSLQAYTEPIALVLILLVVVDAIYLRFRLNKLVRERLPGENTRGLTMYAVFRALQIRRFRVPPPRVQVGDKV
ncbi:MAG: DUF3043 domain-containing protein [Actinobacteria bacterium]|nr:DUF3043 domain-containing protein [Actinomycetota bacterium]